MYNQVLLGIKYALIFLFFALLMGFIYGFFAGILFETALVALTFVGLFSVINFMVALLCLIPLVYFRFRKKNTKQLVRYISISLGFAIVYLPFFVLLKYIPYRLF